MLQVLQLEVNISLRQPAVIRGIFQYRFSDVGTNPFFGGNDFLRDIHGVFRFSGSGFKGSEFSPAVGLKSLTAARRAASLIEKETFIMASRVTQKNTDITESSLTVD